MNDTSTLQPSIIFVIYSPFPDCTGGRENWLHNISRRLAPTAKVTIVSLASRSAPRYEVDERQVRLSRLPSLLYYRLAAAVINRLTGRAVDYLNMLLFALSGAGRLLFTPRHSIVVSLHSHIDFLPGWLARHLRGDLKLVAAVRGRVAQRLLAEGKVGRARRFRKLEAALLRRADLVLVNGKDTEAYVREYDVDCTLIPNGVDIASFSAAAEKEHDNDPHHDRERLAALRTQGKRLILSVATLRDIKGIPVLIEAAAQLKRQIGGSFAVLLVGKGNRLRYQKLIDQHGVAGEVIFLGERPSQQLPPLYQRIDVMTCLSGGGGMSLTALEAMAAGCAIVAWDSDTYRQLFQHNESAILVESGNPLRAAEAIATLLEDSQLRRRLGSRAAQNALPYDWPRVSALFENALKALHEKH